MVIIIITVMTMIMIVIMRIQRYDDGRLRAREGFRKTWTWNQANTFFAISPWRYVMKVKSSTREWPSSVGSASFCPWSRADGSVSTRRPTARPRCAECRSKSLWICTLSSTPIVCPLKWREKTMILNLKCNSALLSSFRLFGWKYETRKIPHTVSQSNRDVENHGFWIVPVPPKPRVCLFPKTERSHYSSSSPITHLNDYSWECV